MLAFLETFQAGTPKELPNTVIAALEDAALQAAEVDLDSFVAALFAADFQDYLMEEYFSEVKAGLLEGRNPVAVSMSATVSMFVHGFCKALQWIEWLKKHNEKETTK